MNKVLLDEYLTKYINCSVAELTKIVSTAQKNAKLIAGGKKVPEGTEDISAMEMMIVRVILEGIKRGDTRHVDFILDRTIGKVKEQVHVSGSAYDSLIEMIRQRKKEQESGA